MYIRFSAGLPISTRERGYPYENWQEKNRTYESSLTTEGS